MTTLKTSVSGCGVELLELVDSAKVIVELWVTGGLYNAQWKKDWLAKANRILDDAQKPVAKEPAHTSCEGCKHQGNKITGDCKTCTYWYENSHGRIRTNWTPAPAPKVTDAPKHKDATDEQTTAWRSVFDLCVELGMEFDEPTGEQDVIAFIRSLAQRAGVGYWVQEIE